MPTAKIKNNFNFKIYLAIAIISTGFFVFLCRNNLEIFAILGCLLATILNHYLLYYAVTEFLNPDYIERPKDRPKVKIIAAIILKFAVLVLAFILAARIMDKRVLMPILNYIVMIFALVIGATYRVRK